MTAQKPIYTNVNQKHLFRSSPAKRFKKMKKTLKNLGEILFLATITTSSTLAQTASNLDRSWPPLSCVRDLDYGITMKASPSFLRNALNSITLSFTRAADAKLKINPSKISLFALPDESRITPVKTQTKLLQDAPDGRITEAIEFILPSTPSLKNIAFVLEEGALYIDRREVELRANLRLMDLASVIRTTPQTDTFLGCPLGLPSWKPKERLEMRLRSTDPVVGAAAADELLRDADAANPESFLMAAHQLFQIGRRNEAVFWRYAGIYRIAYSGQSSVGYGYYIAATQAIEDFARNTPNLLADTLEKVVQWDNKSFPLWLAEQELAVEASKWSQNRTYQREDTREYVRQLRRNPNAPPLNSVYPVSPANPLREAIEKNNVHAARNIVSNGLDLNRTYPHQSSYLHLAVAKGEIELISLLISKGADINAKDYLANTPLGWARDISTMRVLLENGADVNSPQGLDRVTVLYKLASSGSGIGLMNGKKDDSLDRIQLLLTHRADIMKGDAHGNTPLHAAALRGKVSLIQLLLDRGADVNAPTLAGRDRELIRTPLAMAPDVETARLLLKRGAAVKPVNADSPLLSAAWAGNLDVVNLLLDEGSDINAASVNTQSTALYYAISNGDKQHLAVIETLIKRGANVNAKMRGKPLLAWANMPYGGNTAASKLLREAGAED